MTITSVGYAGKITDANWRRHAVATIGATYGVDDFASWRPTAGASDRAVRIAPGGAFGYGVRDSSDAAETVNLAAVGSGSRWDLIVVHRDWVAMTSTLQVIQGTATKALPGRDTGFGATNDQPIALVRVAAGQTVVQEIVDLRVIPGDGGVVALDDLARSYMTRVGTDLRIGDIIWSRVVNTVGSAVWVSSDQSDTGWVAVTRGTGWTLPGSAEWYIPRVRRIGSQVYLRGMIRNNTATASVFNMGTVPAGFRPSIITPLGMYHSSTSHYGELMITDAGLISAINGYYTGSLPVGNAVPLHGSWLVG